MRHAEPEWVRDGLSQDNPPLTARGHRQARRLADRLENEHFDHVYVSPLLRARQTAAPILDAQRRGEVIEPWLEEIRSPIWQGSPAEKAEAAYREEEYWGRPVSGWGDPKARILVVGLAPGAHGANRTGRRLVGECATGRLNCRIVGGQRWTPADVAEADRELTIGRKQHAEWRT
ncbi:MAG: hypothetical protein EBY98_06365 [Acidimicrobiia bacterium]|nr:hypothetical protein [Acidimicrobiia bacterium]